LQAWLFVALSAAAHGFPSLAAAVVTVYVATCVPAPQFREQAPNAPHLPTQLTAPGQALTVHARTFVAAGHAVPPFAAAVVALKVATCAPRPHVLEQALQPPYAPAQFTFVAFDGLGAACSGAGAGVGLLAGGLLGAGVGAGAPTRTQVVNFRSFVNPLGHLAQAVFATFRTEPAAHVAFVALAVPLLAALALPSSDSSSSSRQEIGIGALCQPAIPARSAMCRDGEAR